MMKNVFWMTSESSVWDVRNEVRGEEMRCKLVDHGRMRSDPSAFRQIRQGDRIYCYFTDGKIRGIYSELKCTGSFVARGRGGYFLFKKVRDFPAMVTWEDICADTTMKKSRVVKVHASGTLFSLSNAEAAALKRLVERADKGSSRRYWLYAPGDKASHWESDVADGVMALDMDDVPNLRGMSAEMIARRMCQFRHCRGAFAGVGRYAVRFVEDVREGDVVFAKLGLHKLLGVGVVTGGYMPLPLRECGIHTRAVRWFCPAKQSRRSFNFGQPAFYAVKKNDIKAMFDAIGISESDLLKGRNCGGCLKPKEGMQAEDRYAIVGEKRRPCPKKACVASVDNWTRDERCVKTAIVKAGFNCELDPSHDTFVCESGKRYLEGHHLVGMRHQGLFKSVSLDNPANIVALCPNCHRLMHFGTAAERTKALTAFYKARRVRLAKAGIKISEAKFVKLGLS